MMLLRNLRKETIARILRILEFEKEKILLKMLWGGC
jgi:hypothetical protein